MVRLQPDQLGMLDAWRSAQRDKPTRPEAVRRLLAKPLEQVQIDAQRAVILAMMDRDK